MGKTHKDTHKNWKIGIPSNKQKEPGKKVRQEEFMDNDLEDDSLHLNSSHS